MPPQTKRERMVAGVASIPFILFSLAFPVYSVLALRSRVGSRVSFVDAFLHLLILMASVTFGDLVLLDWLVITKITPEFVVIPGSEADHYKDFSHHYRGHLRAAVVMVIVSALIATIVNGL